MKISRQQLAKIQKKEKGRPPKIGNGLDCVLYVRANAELIALLDSYVIEQRELHPGQQISRADAARALLFQSLMAKHDDPHRQSH